MLGTQYSWMGANLDINSHSVINLATPQPSANDHAADVGFFNDQLNASNLNIVGIVSKETGAASVGN